MRRLRSLALLGLHFFLHWIRKAWPWRRRGLALVREYYGPDRIGSYTSDDVARFPSFSKCTACNLCRAGMPVGYSGPMPDALPLALTRTPTLAWTVAEELAAHIDWTNAESLCPVSVPLRDAAAFVLAQSRATGPSSRT